MMNCFRRNGLLSFLITAVLAAACTKVDDTLGDEFIPDNQQLDATIALIGTNKDEPVYFRSYLVQQDSVRSSALGMVTIGSRFDATFGYNSASAIIQPVPFLPHSTDKYFGYNPVIDSVSLQLYMAKYGGKTDVEQSFSIYRVNKDIDRDSTYYASYPAATVCEMGSKLFAFKHSGTGSISIKLDILPAGQQYINELVAADLSIESDSLFLKQFKGLYIVPDQKKADAAQYRTLLNHDNGSALVIHFHNYEQDSPTTVKDTLDMPYVFTDRSSNSNYFRYESTSINAIERDYTAGTLSSLINSGTEVGVAYVEGMDGVYTELRIDPMLLTHLQSLCPAGKKMMVNNAMIYLELQPGYTPAILNNSFTRLGMFYDYAKFRYIPDYNFIYENNPDGGAIMYGGYLNRSTGNFAMNITQTVQKMMSSGKISEKICLTPDVTATFDFNQTALRGSAGGGYKVKLKITYTLVVP